MIRRRRRLQRGAETLEFLGVLPLTVLVAMLAWQGIVLAREQAQADADARTLARQAVVCAAPGTAPLALAAVDPVAFSDEAGVVTRDTTSNPPYVSVTVALAAKSIFKDVDLARFGIPGPHAVVVMRHEPC